MNIENVETSKEEPQTETVSEIELENVYAPQRLQGESYQDYRDRRLVAKYKFKQSQNKLFWNTRELGTYRKTEA
jgi:hypothetical protein